MINEVRFKDSQLAISISLDSEIRLMQTIDRYTGSQLYLFKGIDRDDLYVLLNAITSALELEG
jgi:hypothetical protein